MKQCMSWLGGALIARRSACEVSRAERRSEGGKWRSYGGDLANTRYSPLDHITAENFSKLV